MKDIFVAGKENIAIRMNKDGKGIATVGKDTVEALLLSVKACLEKVATNDDNSQEPVTVFLPGHIKGIATGSVMHYIRTGKTGGDKEITQSNLDLYREVMTLYGQRNLNVSFRDAQYFGKSESEVKLKELNDKAWKLAKDKAKERALSGANVAPAQPEVNPKVLAKIAELEEQLMDAMLDDNEELEKELDAKIAKLKAKFGVEGTVKAEDKKENPEVTVTEEKKDSEEINWDEVEEEA